MTNKKQLRTKPQADPLTEPIVRPSDLAVALTAYRYRDRPAIQKVIWDEARKWVVHQKVQKLLLLFERYALQPGQPGSELLLSLRLAEEHVEGFRVVDHLARTAGRPKGAGHKLDRFEVYKAVSVECHVKGCSVAEACRALVKTRKPPWRGVPAKSLATRYYEQLAEFDAAKKKLADGTKSAFWQALEVAVAQAEKSL